MSEFKIGDVVELKSGGEAMTVEGVEADGVDCVWFEKKSVQRSTFVAATLRKYQNPGLGAVGVTRR